MTEEEIRKFHELMDRAKEGHTSNYAEERLDDGSYLGVNVVKEHPQFKEPTPQVKTNGKSNFRA